MSVATLPYKVGLVSALTAAALSFPLTFDLTLVSWFNYNFVTAGIHDLLPSNLIFLFLFIYKYHYSEVPPPHELDTWLEVGSWAWNWVEPVCGQISFALICLQVLRYLQ